MFRGFRLRCEKDPVRSGQITGTGGRYYEGSLTGPLGHSKKTTFLLSLDQDEDNRVATVQAEKT